MYSVLHVDDEAGFLDMNKLLLEKTGEFVVDTVQSAPEALEKIRNTDYDAVVSDYNMPDMDGIALLKQIRSDYGNLPYLLFTGKGREDVVIAAVDNGVDYYIQKGTDINAMIAELRHKIKRAIDRRRMKDELEKSHQRLENIINFLPDATFVRDISGRVIAWNKAMEKMTGIPGHEILGKGDMEYSIPFYNEKRPLLIDLVLGEYPPAKSSYRYFEKAGDKITSEVYIPHFNEGEGANLWITASPLYDAGGAVTGAIESFRDISDLYAMRRDLNLFRDMVQGFADIIPVAIFETDPGFNLTFVNRHGYGWFGLSREDITRKVSILQYIAPDDRERFAEDMKNITGGSEGSGMEYLLLRPDGTTFAALMYGAKITNPDTGEPAGVRGVIIDLSESKKGEQELYESRERLDLALIAGDVSIWDVDIRTMKVRDVHQWLCHTLGYQPADLPEITIPLCKNLVHPMDIPRVVSTFLNHMSGNNPLLETQLRLACRDGSWKWVTVRGKVIEWGESREPVRITGTINTIAPPRNKG
ncbi:MAG: PAS domain S-box protein [Methanoregula sp.]|nr:PAS domain S-box protein [Methanoregula sp.]